MRAGIGIELRKTLRRLLVLLCTECSYLDPDVVTETDAIPFDKYVEELPKSSVNIGFTIFGIVVTIIFVIVMTTILWRRSEK